MFPTPSEIENNWGAYNRTVLLPEMLCDGELFEQQFKQSDAMVADLTQDDTIAGMASRVLQHAPKHFSVIGLGLGGMVIFELMRRAPERLLGVIVMNTTHKRMYDDTRAKFLRWSGMAEQGKFAGAVEDIIASGFVSAARQGDVALIKQVKAMAMRVGADAFVKQANAIITRPDNTPAIQTFGYAVDVFAGELNPWYTVQDHYELKRLFGSDDAFATVFKACGHLCTVECGKAVNTSINQWYMLLSIRMLMRAEDIHNESDHEKK